MEEVETPRASLSTSVSSDMEGQMEAGGSRSESVSSARTVPKAALNDTSRSVTFVESHPEATVPLSSGAASQWLPLQ